MKRRVLRGGSYYDVAGYLRTAIRDRWDVPEFRYGYVGFRIVVRRRKKQ